MSFEESINWIKDVNWAISLLAAIPLSVLANLLTPNIQNWLGRRSEKRSKKRLKQLEEQRETFIKYNENRTLFLIESTSVVLKVIVLIGLGNALNSIPIFWEVSNVAAALAYLMSVNIALPHLNLINRLKNFDLYNEKIESEMQTLSETAGKN
ncbi:hypothetical protein [Vibrio campbellii]|uniref:hypothetical protein n=1 Tax=Vibrio campbellii TaxID=680 RepID=UPI0038CD1B84